MVPLLECQVIIPPAVTDKRSLILAKGGFLSVFLIDESWSCFEVSSFKCTFVEQLH